MRSAQTATEALEEMNVATCGRVTGREYGEVRGQGRLLQEPPLRPWMKESAAAESAGRKVQPQKGLEGKAPSTAELSACLQKACGTGRKAGK